MKYWGFPFLRIKLSEDLSVSQQVWVIPCQLIENSVNSQRHYFGFSLYLHSVYIYAIHGYVQICRPDIIIAFELQAIKEKGGSGNKANFPVCTNFE